MTGCQCPIAGWCERHKLRRIGRLHELCQTDDRYFELFEAQSQFVSQTKRKLDHKSAQAKKEKLLEKYHELWKQLHLYKQDGEWASAECEKWYKAWCKRIPKKCPCADHWKAITSKLKPDYTSQEAFHAWSIAAHNAVNKQLGKPMFVENKTNGDNE